MQRIIVKNFGPLKDIDLEIKDYMIFLGPQASGKSTLAKLIYGFKEVIWNAFNNESNSLWNLINNSNQYSFSFDLDEWISLFRVNLLMNLNHYENFTITYTYQSNISLTVFDIYGIISIELSNGFYDKLSAIEKQVETELQKLDSYRLEDSGYIRYFINNIVAKELTQSFGSTNIFFVPDKRDINHLEENSRFSNYIKRNRTNFKEGFKSIENFLMNIFGSYEKKKFNIIRNFYSNILKGDFHNLDSGRIVLTDGTKISIDSASSGQKEVVGILIVLIIEIFINKNRFYVIEEPEAHLFPEAQKDITYLISLLANQEGNQVIITTHSHYILGALNILINAHRIGQTNPEEVEKIVPRELWVDKNRIFAGFLENGIIKDIYDDEAEMIKIQQLNAVAGEINKDFDRLLDLEFANENV